MDISKEDAEILLKANTTIQQICALYEDLDVNDEHVDLTDAITEILIENDYLELNVDED